MAIEKNNMEIIQILLSNQEIDLNVKFNFGGLTRLEKTALSLAIEKNNTELITLLLSKTGIDTNVKLINNHRCSWYDQFVFEEQTVLSKAVEDKNIELIKLLLSNPNTDPNLKLTIKDHENEKILFEQSALLIATMKRQKYALNLFLNCSRNVAREIVSQLFERTNRKK
ncbi:hypothetical protein M9Y10_004431 [Tritrichomonas musculus]|uniref:Ankyrin repeat protein n=1 Tax=Tritrichomonas musculus TaxID=1915356 RepID=A0ABR2JSC9_9EUKA